MLAVEREAARLWQRCQRLSGGVAFDLQRYALRTRGITRGRGDPHPRCRDATHPGHVAQAVDAVPEQVEADADVAHAGRGEGADDVVDDLHARTPCARRAGIATFGDPVRGIGGPPVAWRAARIAAFLRECPMASARPVTLWERPWPLPQGPPHKGDGQAPGRATGPRWRGVVKCRLKRGYRPGGRLRQTLRT